LWQRRGRGGYLTVRAVGFISLVLVEATGAYSAAAARKSAAWKERFLCWSIIRLRAGGTRV
jgi:hypothetical protein